MIHQIAHKTVSQSEFRVGGVQRKSFGIEEGRE